MLEIKKIFFLFLILIFSSACSLGYNKKDSSVIVDEVNSTDMKDCEHDVQSLNFSYPKNWESCRVDNNNIYFKTDYKKWQVNLVITVIQLTQDESSKYYWEYESYDNMLKDPENSDFLEYTNDNKGIILTDPCGGALFCYIFKIEDKIYKISGVVESNQMAPIGTDGVWSPNEHNVKRDVISKIMKSIKLIK